MTLNLTEEHYGLQQWPDCLLVVGSGLKGRASKRAHTTKHLLATSKQHSVWSYEQQTNAFETFLLPADVSNQKSVLSTVPLDCNWTLASYLVSTITDAVIKKEYFGKGGH
jgi:hypothetical protein